MAQSIPMKKKLSDEYIDIKKKAVKLNMPLGEREDKLHELENRYVYAINSDSFPGIYKIGMTRDIKSRLSQLNCSMPEHPYKLVTQFTSLNPRKDEKDAHAFFAMYHVKGEHFKIPHKELMSYFESRQSLKSMS